MPVSRSRSGRPRPPPIAAKADDLEALRDAVVEAASASGALWATYLGFLFYLLVAAGAVTHKDLFFENGVKLPFLGIDLPLTAFFWLGPLLFLVMHLYTLVHLTLLADKVAAFDAALLKQVSSGEMRVQLRRQLPSNVFVQFLAGPEETRRRTTGLLLRGIAWITLVFGPVALLIFFQVRFLPYHSEPITWVQRITVTLDVFFICRLWPGIVNRAGTGWWRLLGRASTTAILRGLSVVALSFVFLFAIFPGEALPKFPARPLLFSDEIDYMTQRPKGVLADRLVLPRLDVVDHSKLDTPDKIAAAPPTRMRGRHLEQAVLNNAMLRNVDFTGAYLQGATLELATLQNASLDFARLQGASLLDAQLQGASFFNAQLQGASFAGAKLQGASLFDAQLQGAEFFGARLQGTTLTGAQLQGASLISAPLQGALLDGAQLQDVRLDDAQLQGASLVGAQLQGASLTYAHLQGASLDHVQLQGASLIGAHLQGASLFDAQLQGAQLDYAQLQGASLQGAQLQAASLVHTFVWRTDPAGLDFSHTRIGLLETGELRLCEPPQSLQRGHENCEWTPQDFGTLLKQVRDNIPQERVGAVLARLDPRLNPDKPLDHEEDMISSWQSAAATNNANGPAEWRSQWQIVGCSAVGAPYILRAWIGNRGNTGIVLSDTANVSVLAADFLKPDCDGTKGLSDAEMATLRKLAAQATPAAPPAVGAPAP